MNTPHNAVILAADAIARVTAYHIAQQAQTDPNGAAQRYQQHIGDLSPEAAKLFASYIVGYVREMEQQK
jgi:hypothetical protein